MVSKIRLYIEGGGSKGDGRTKLRKGFREFLREVDFKTKESAISFKIIMSGSRHEALRDFRNGCEDHPDGFNCLLVDSELPVNDGPLKHLEGTEKNWDLSGVRETQCQLMVQVMESWFLCDLEALMEYYGSGLKTKLIKIGETVESISKQDINNRLETATRDTKKGKYHKIHHAHELLGKIRAQQVRLKSKHCDRLFRTLLDMAANP